MDAGSTTIRQYLKFESPMGFRDELVYGKIIVSPQPKPLHFVIADNIYKLLESAAGKRYWVAQRINLHFPSAKSMPSPDVFVIAREAFKAAIRASSYPEGSAAILAVEVLSPSNRKKHIDLKVELYREHGIEVWVVHPKSGTVKVYSDGGVQSLATDKGAKLVLPKLLGGKAISLARVFRVPS